jgi:Ras-related protein Rab-8A
MPAPPPAPPRRGDFDVQLKLLLVGDSGVGKTSLLQRFTADAFTASFISTIGIDFKTKVLELDGTRVRLQIWDTAGQERFRTITTSYFRGAHGIALCFDATDRRSFASVTAWMAQVADNADAGVQLVLVGTKSDAPAAVSREEALAAAARFAAPGRDVPVVFSSAKANVGVAETFEGLAARALAQMLAGAPAARAARAADEPVRLGADGGGGGAGGGGSGGDACARC